jgi:hypothetical protein
MLCTMTIKIASKDARLSKPKLRIKQILMTLLTRSGPAHSNSNDPAFHLTVVCKDAEGEIVTVRHAYVEQLDE